MGRLPRFIRALQFNIEDQYGFFADKVTEDKLLEIAEKVRANTLIVFARDAWGRVFYDGSKLYPKHPRSRLDVKELVAKARKKGIKVIIMALHTANRYIFKLHPDWAQRTKDGEVVVLEHVPVDERIVDPHWPQICINSPAMEQFFLPEAKESMTITRADGLLLDSFRYIPDMSKACYCRYCRDLFRRETSFDLPHRKDVDSEAYRLAWEWRYKKIVDAIRRVKEALEEVDPEAPLLYNSHPAGWAGRANRVAELARDYLDGVFAEASEVDVKGPGLLTFIAKLSRSLIGRDSWKPVLVTRNLFYFVRTPQSAPAPTIRQGVREIVAAGGMPVATMFSSQLFTDPRALDALSQVYAELERIEEYLVNVKPVYYAGLVYSTFTHDWFIHDRPDYYVGEVEGFAHMLMHSHLPWIMLSDTDLENGLDPGELPVLITPSLGILDDRAEESLRRYVENGGVLIVTNALGVVRKDFTYRLGLAAQDVLGLYYEGRMRLGYVYVNLGSPGDPTYEEYWAGLPSSIPFGDHNTAFRRTRWDPRLGEASRVVVTTARILARLQMPRKPWGYEYTLGRSLPPPGPTLDAPAITLNRYGKGYAVFYAVKLGIHYNRLGQPDYLELFTRILNRVAPKPKVTIEAPDTVQAEYYSQGDRLIIHLVNHTYNQRILDAPVGAARQALPPFDPTYSIHPIRNVIPVAGVRVRAMLPQGRYKVRLAISGHEDTVEAGGRGLEYTVNELGEYEVVVIEPRH